MLEKPLAKPLHKVPLVSSVIANMLQDQIKKELDSSHIYYGMSVWCDDRGFMNSASLFKKYADEERTHAQMIITYLLDRNVKAVVTPVDFPLNEFRDLRECYYRGYEHELKVEKSLVEIALTAQQEMDVTTRIFIEHTLVLEQIEEAAKFKLALDMFDTMTSADNRDYLFDIHNVSKLNLVSLDY
jgi:ferritin